MEQIIGALIRTLYGGNRADRPESGGAFIGSPILAVVDDYPLTCLMMSPTSCLMSLNSFSSLLISL